MRKDAEGRKLEPVLNKGLGLGAWGKVQGAGQNFLCVLRALRVFSILTP